MTRASHHRWLVILLGASFACSSGAREEDAGNAVASRGADDAVPVADEASSSFAPSPECVHPPAKRSCKDDLCTIPAGCFVMGAPRDAITGPGYDNQEVEVRLTHAFVIGETELTRAQWFALGLPEPFVDWSTWKTEEGEPYSEAPPGQSLCLEPDCPVVWLSFEDAVSYANLRSESEGLKPCYILAGCVRNPGSNLRCASVRVDAKNPYACEGYRLPTEAEWEYAARAGTRTDLYSGNLDSSLESDAFDCKLDKNLDRIGWYCGNSNPSHMAGTGHPYPVAQKEPNGFGLYDVSGNAFEWANDRYRPAGYGSGPLTDPVNGVDDPSNLTPNTPVFEGMTDGNFVDGFPGYRIRRSGAFDLWSRMTGSGARDDAYSAGQHTGMRIARTLDAGLGGETP